MKQIAILGSTGSIGTQTLDVVRQHPSEFSVYALSAHRNVTLLIQQMRHSISHSVMHLATYLSR